MEIELIQDVDVGYVPPTPLVPTYGREIAPVAYDSIMSHASSYGTVVGYEQEQNGQRVQHILPNPKTEHGQISTSSKTELELHTETAFHPYKPEYVLLLCVRGDPSAVTTFARLSRIVDKLQYADERAFDTLTVPLFETSLDESFRENDKADASFTLPVLRLSLDPRRDDAWEITYDHYLMRGLTEEAQRALNVLDDVIKECTEAIILEQGDLLVMDNRRIVHGRKPFQARYDGTDRWLLRALTKRPLPAKEQYDFSRSVITTTFNNKTV